jgi:uncharacterized membrane protein
MSFLPDPLHPALVHFPIALSLLALLFDLAARHPRARHWTDGAVALWLAAALGAVVAVLTGNAAHDDAVVPPAARALVERHHDLAVLAMWLLVALAALRLALAFKGWFRGVAAWLLIALAAGLAGLVGYVGHLGGQMVFKHGVGTAPVQRGLVVSTPAGGSGSS